MLVARHRTSWIGTAWGAKPFLQLVVILFGCATNSPCLSVAYKAKQSTWPFGSTTVRVVALADFQLGSCLLTCLQRLQL